MTSSRPPPAFFRSVVIVGCVALLFGVAGIFYFRNQDAVRAARRPADATTVSVRGLPSIEGIQVRATWLGPEGDEQAETGKPSAEAGLWRFQRTPEGIPVTVEVVHHAQGAKRTLHAQPAIFTRGALFEVWLPDNR